MTFHSVGNIYREVAVIARHLVVVIKVIGLRSSPDRNDNFFYRVLNIIKNVLKPTGIIDSLNNITLE